MTRRSVIELKGRAFLQNAVDASSTFSDVLRQYGLSPVGSGGRTVLYRLLDDWEIDLSTFHENPRKAYGGVPPQIDHNDLFVKDSPYTQTTLRRYARRVLDNSYCWICRITDQWNGQTISMILDHINGDNTDHRKENLRFICPNCNSLLDTTGSRNGRKHSG